MRDALTPETEFSLTPDTAKLVLASRIGLSDLYSISTNDADIIEQVATLGGPRQQHSFSSELYQRILVVIEDESMLEDDSLFISNDGKQFRTSYIFPTPNSEATEQLLTEFRSVSLTHKGDVSYGEFPWALRELGKRPGNSLQSELGRGIVHVKSSRILSEKYGKSSQEAKEERVMIGNFIRALRLVKDGVVTVVVLPNNGPKSSSWGPKLQRRNAAEALLSTSPNTAESSPEPEIFHTTSTQAKTSPIPARYDSVSSCMKTTGNCTGHGECLRLFAEKDGDRTNEVFGCVCNKPSVRENKDGSKKTTYYGGSACQKVDVSGPFWLLAGTTVFLITILSFGLGVLYSMGNEELPSVIGAGVTGPRAK